MSLQVLKSYRVENSRACQWLGLGASTAEGTGSIPHWGTKIPHAVRCSQKRNIKFKKTSMCLAIKARVVILINTSYMVE